MPRDPAVAGDRRRALAWERVDVADARALAALAPTLDEFARRARGFSLFHDPRWLLQAEDRRPADVEIYVVRNGDALAAYAAFVVQPWPMRFRAGEVVLFSLPFRRLHAHAGPVTDGTDERVARDLASALIATLRPRLARRDVLYFEGVAVGGPVDRAIAEDAAGLGYRVLEPLPRFDRQRARLPATFDDYLGAMKSQTRQNLRNARRRLERAHAPRLLCCAQESEVDAFVARAVEVSRKTYQWRLLGLGLRDAPALARTLRAMAAAGFTRCYLLECDGAATAFMLGYLYGRTYHYVDVGFDPDWEKWSVGTVLHFEVMRDLIEGGHADAFDFSTGTGVHKKRFGNEARPEAHYALFPATARTRALLAAYRAADRASSALGRALDRVGAKSALKRFVRRTATGDAGERADAP